LLLTSGLRALQAALLLACLGMLVSGVAAALGGQPPEPFELPASTAPSAPDLSFDRFAVIESRDLFATRKPGPGEGELIVEEVLPPSKAEWKLIGTISAADPKLAVATLEHKRTRGLRGAWRPGEDIEAGLNLVRVEPRRVVVKRDGRHEQIPMDDEQGPLSGPDQTAAAAPAAVPSEPSPAERREAARQERVDRMAEQREQQRLEELRVQAEAEAAARVQAQPMPGQQRLETLMEGLKMTPVQDENGELQDILVEPNANMADNPFANTPAGTRCHTLNGHPMNRMHEGLATLSDDAPACLQCTLPDGTAHTICF
jgi:hypothetical protein